MDGLVVVLKLGGAEVAQIVQPDRILGIADIGQPQTEGFQQHSGVKIGIPDRVVQIGGGGADDLQPPSER